MEVRPREINFKILFKIFVKRLWVIVLVALIAMLGTFTFLKVTYKPKYKSVTDLYLLTETGTVERPNISNDFSLALKLVDDCKYIIYSDAVLDVVSDNLSNGLYKIDITTQQLKKAIQVKTSDEVRFITLSVEWKDPAEAKIIVDEVANLAVDKANETMKNDTMGTKGVIKVYSEGKIPNKPSNIPSVGKFIIAGLIGAILTYIVFLIMYIVDDKVRNGSDVKKYFNLSILGEIPNLELIEKENRRYAKYGKYRNRYASYYKSNPAESDKGDKEAENEKN